MSCPDRCVENRNKAGSGWLVYWMAGEVSGPLPLFLGCIVINTNGCDPFVRVFVMAVD